MSDADGAAPLFPTGTEGYRALAASLPGAAVFVFDRKLFYRLAEGHALRDAGLAPSNFTGKTIREALGDALADEYEPRLRNSLAGESFVHEHHSHGRDYVSHGSPVTDASGQIAGVLVVSYDVTDRRRAEEAQRRSEQRYRALSLATSDVAYGMSADWSVMLPLDGRGLVASNEEPIPGWLEKNIPPEEHVRIRDGIAKAIATKSLFEMEHRVRRPDGSVGWTLSRAVPILDDAGEIVEWFGAASDITERKRVEQELALSAAALDRQQRLYEAILDNTPDLAYIFDLDHRFIYANRVLLAMWGRTWDEAIGRNCLELGYEPWHAEMHDREIEQVVATKGPIRGVVPFEGTFGRRLYDYIFVPVLNDRGEVVAVAGTTRDVTEMRLAEEEVKRLNGSLEETVRERTAELLATNEQLQGFTYSVAHDLRQQIRGINSNASLVIEDAGSRLDEESLERLSRLRQAAKRLGTVVDDLLAFARYGRKEPVVQEVDLTAVASKIVEAIHEEGRYSSEPATTIEPGLVAKADPSLIAIVLDNLLDNAFKYSARSPSPQVRFGVEGGAFYVSDNGAGFDMEHATRLFEPFERLHSAEEFPGTGIGLANVRRIVRKHGGDVWAESRPGDGAKFWFTLGPA